jgi:hypothetical protein
MGSFFNYKSSPKIFVAFFPHRKSNGLILPKTGWAAYWATFLQTHLVTLHTFMYL